MNAKPQPHFYRVHDNGWISRVAQEGNADFAVSVGRGIDGARFRRTTTDLAAAQRLADSALPDHACAGGCTPWFEIKDPGSAVDFTAICPRQHTIRLSYTVSDALLRLTTLSFWCLQCGRSWPATDEQLHQLLAQIVRGSGSGD